MRHWTINFRRGESLRGGWKGPGAVRRDVCRSDSRSRSRRARDSRRASSQEPTCQPASSSRSCTNRAPFIDSIAARIGTPWPATRSLRRCSPSASGGVAPRSTVTPSPSSKWKSRRLRLRSKPAYNIATGLPSSVKDARSIAPREALLHGIPYHGGSEAVAAYTPDHSRPRLSCKSANQPTSVCRQCPRVLARARADVPVSYPRHVVCSPNGGRLRRAANWAQPLPRLARD